MKICYLITGGNGNLARQYAEKIGRNGCQIVLVDISPTAAQPLPANCEYAVGDITDPAVLSDLFRRYQPSHVLHFASILSGRAEEDRRLAWRVNGTATFELLELAITNGVRQFFLPSTGATYGPNVPDPLPEDCPQWPINLYGVTKVATERLGNYYFSKHGLDFRCVRLPLIISRYAPRSAVSAYASHAFVAASKGEPFSFPVGRSSGLSTIYVKDVLEGITQFLETPSERLTRRVYNLHGMSPTAEQIALAIAARIPSFAYRFEPAAAVTRLVDAWPFCHADRSAREDWGWNPQFDLDRMTEDLLEELRITPE